MLTVIRTGGGTSTVTSTPVGIDCGATCVNSFDGGTVVTLLPHAERDLRLRRLVRVTRTARTASSRWTPTRPVPPTFNNKPDLTVINLAAPVSTGAGLTITVTDTTRNLSGGPAFPGHEQHEVLAVGRRRSGRRRYPPGSPAGAVPQSGHRQRRLHQRRDPGGNGAGQLLPDRERRRGWIGSGIQRGQQHAQQGIDDPGPGSHGHRPLRADHLGGEPHNLDHGQDAQRRRRKRGTALDDQLLPLHRLRVGRRRHALWQPRGSCSDGGIQSRAR